jgi:hypothetical protein
LQQREIEKGRVELAYTNPLTRISPLQIDERQEVRCRHGIEGKIVRGEGVRLIDPKG